MSEELKNIDGILTSSVSDSVILLEMVLVYCRLRPKMKYRNICLPLSKHYNINITERRLEYIIKKQGLTRKKNVTDAL